MYYKCSVYLSMCVRVHVPIFQDTCDLDYTSYTGFTALFIACKEGNTRSVECLVGYGADLNIADELGNTALHFVLAKKNMKPLSDWTPHLNKVHYTHHISSSLRLEVF